MQKSENSVLRVAIAAGLIVAVILVIGTVLMGRGVANDTEAAIHSVSMLYLDELAGRRERVVAANLATNIRNLEAALGLMDERDTADDEHLQAFQAEIKQLYELERFAFVDEDGIIHTADGLQYDIEDFSFDPHAITGPEISIRDQDGKKKVIIAEPVEGKSIGGKRLVACFMQIDMDRMLEGVSMKSGSSDTTFCNIYTKDGRALTNVVLGGLASEDNLLDALSNADFRDGATAADVVDDFENLRGNVVTFSYNGILETLAYVPIEGTDWLLTYLIRESVISEQIGSVTDDIVRRSTIQSALIAAMLFGLFAVVVGQTRKNAELALEKETAETENRVKREELEERLALQDQLLEQERKRTEQDSMITALASDYRSVHYVNLDTDEGICYRADTHMAGSLKEGDRFPFSETFANYAETQVAPSWREEFLHFCDIDSIRRRLQESPIIVHRYLTERDGVESYEMLRMAGVRHIEDRKDGLVHAVGVGFTNIDAEMRESMARNIALSDALAAAEDASKAKTTFLSNMSHEIRTPMNAIIGLDDIALATDDLDDRTRGHLEKIGESARHLLSLINDILDVSRIESSRMTLKNEEFSFSELLEQVNTMFSGQCQEAGLTYSCRIMGEVDDYYIGDVMKLRQVLINILGNACKFTPEGGSVSLVARRVAQFDGKTTLEFEIADTGIGMSKEFLPHVFDTFAQEDASSTNRYGSSGLGLAITKSIVEMMNGNIEVASVKGEGSTFTVTVTLMDADHDALADEIEVDPREISVLVVDDDPRSCEHARLVLEKVGISCDVTQSGFEAVEMAKLRHARRQLYNLILVDWKMPEMDGVECARRIRQTTGDETAIVILTAYRFDDAIDDAREAGVDSFITKPLFVSTVLEEFREAMRRKNVAHRTAQAKAGLAGRRVLLAEDVDLNAEIMAMVLAMREIETERAVNGRVAVDMFAEAEPGHYDAVLMDIRMPEMDGLEATETIRAMGRADAKTIPIIALTANAFDEDVQRSLQAGMNAHLSKPIEPDVLFATLEDLL